MDHSVGDYFLAIENNLLEFLTDNKKRENATVTISGVEYKKVAICPLMIHFYTEHKPKKKNDKGYQEPDKPIEEQTVDLFFGIRDYYKKSEYKLLKFYPFMGVSVKDGAYDVEKFKKLLDKYFSNYPVENRQKLLENDYEEFSGDISKLGNQTFAGIKVYPPNGFDTLPKNGTTEREKVELLYKKCDDNHIPIITHCGGNGFRTVGGKKYRKLRDPERWRQVLIKHKNLKVCFAHFGRDIKFIFPDKYTLAIIDLIDDFDNVYADISFYGCKKSYFEKLIKLIKKKAGDDEEKYNKILSRILYGSDFPMNLFKSDNYSDYIKAFSEWDDDESIKKALCEDNPQKFLFG